MSMSVGKKVAFDVFHNNNNGLSVDWMASGNGQEQKAVAECDVAV